MLDYYQKLLDTGKIEADDAQKDIAIKLEQLEEKILGSNKKSGVIKKIFGKQKESAKGLYIYGKVGRGKSMLMDGFYENLQIKSKKRSHFHEFMQEVHSLIHEYRSEGVNEPLVLAAQKIGEGLRLFCLDEFEVTDVTDAMILSRLFEELMEMGVILVFTSNKQPEDHYKEGLQRQAYLEFCKLLRDKVEVVSLDSKQDYRQLYHATDDNYFSPINYENIRLFKERYKELCKGELKDREIKVKGRTLKLKACDKLALTSFQEICGQALGANDYLKLAEEFDIIFMENIPQLLPEMRNEAKRFINLIDILYQAGTLFICTAEVVPEQLYESGTGKFEFARTASRLTEMRSWKPKN